MRKCVGCGEMKAKKDLCRVVKTVEGTIVLDTTGKQNGRGAYICKSMDCLKMAEKNRGLNRSLETQIPKEVYERLEGELNGEQ